MNSFAAISLLLLTSISAVTGKTTGDLQLLIYETDAEHSTILEEQAVNIPGVTATIIGQGSTFEGFGSKYEAIIPALRKMDANALVVLSDSRDVLINHPLIQANAAASTTGHEFIQAFQTLTAEYPGAIVASAEAQCCVGALSYANPGDYFDKNGHRRGRACASGHAPCLWNGDDKVVPWENFMKDLAVSKMTASEDMYLNAGLIAGKAKDMLRVFEVADFEVHEDDQAVLTDYMFRRPNELILDYDQVLFGNNRHATKGCVFQSQTKDKRLIHLETGATPLFIHSPGGYVSCHERLAALLGVTLHSSAFERRMLQDWKRDLQNYRTPTDVPSQSPSRRPVKAPVKAPVAAPVPIPVPTPIAVPVVAPSNATAPVKAPASAPVPAPVPVPVPVPTPVKAPVPTPVKAPVPTPVKTPVKLPTAPTKSPTKVPTKSPTKAPTRPQRRVCRIFLVKRILFFLC